MYYQEYILGITYTIYAVALDLAFSSMYRDTVPVTVDRICPTVAAATMLQLVCTTCVLYIAMYVCVYAPKLLEY